MLLEFLYELFTDLTPVYIYVSILLSVFCVVRLIPQFDIYTKKKFDIKLQRLERHYVPIQDTVNEIIEKRNWLAIIAKRMEVPDDDEEGASFSFYRNRLEKRGGTTCKQNLYSHALRKRVLLEHLF